MANRRLQIDQVIAMVTEEDDDGDGSLSDVSIHNDSENDNNSSSEAAESDTDDQPRPNIWTVNSRKNIPKTPFSGPNPGATIHLARDATELDFFELFFPPGLVEMLCRQTNLYARQRQITKPDPNWRPVFEEEMMAWLGIRVYMSILVVSSRCLEF